MTDIVEAAEGRWHHVLTTLGIDPKHLGVNKPCPVCGGDDRFSFTDKGKGFYFCRGGHKGEGFKLLYEVFGWEFKRAAKEVQRVLGVPEKVRFASRPDPVRALRAVYKGSYPVREGDPVDRYLKARGLSLLPGSLRYHPGLKVERKTFPCMLALLYDVTGKAVSIHRTFIDGSQKAPVEAPKRLMPPVTTVTGAAIRLWPAESAVGLAEGIETAVSAYELFGVPTWACASAHGLEAVLLPSTIQEVYIYPDHDTNYVGLKAAYVLAERLHREGRAVRVSIPPVPGMDWNDEVLLRKGKAA